MIVRLKAIKFIKKLISSLSSYINLQSSDLCSSRPIFYWHYNDGGVWSDGELFDKIRLVIIVFAINLTFIALINLQGNSLYLWITPSGHCIGKFFLPGLGRSEWIKSTDPVNCMSLSPGQIWSMPINLGCSNHSVCSALSDHLNLFMLYLINLVIID